MGKNKKDSREEKSNAFASRKRLERRGRKKAGRLLDLSEKEEFVFKRVEEGEKRGITIKSEEPEY